MSQHLLLLFSLVLPHALPGMVLAPILGPSLPSLLESSGIAHFGPTSPAPPRSPRDCPACCLAPTLLSAVGSIPVRPWCEVKSRRGAPKRVDTEGFACPNNQCPYAGITDAHMHALVGDGKHGHAERVFGHRQATIISLSDSCWRARADLARTLASRHLHLPHLQLDELRTRLRSYTQVLWLWLAIDPLSKIIPVLHLGSRTQIWAHKVIHSLRQVLAPGCVPLFISDGLNLYFYAALGPFWTLA